MPGLNIINHLDSSVSQVYCVVPLVPIERGYLHLLWECIVTSTTGHRYIAIVKNRVVDPLRFFAGFKESPRLTPESMLAIEKQLDNYLKYKWETGDRDADNDFIFRINPPAEYLALLCTYVLGVRKLYILCILEWVSRRIKRDEAHRNVKNRFYVNFV